ncbi:hypothetical protein L226DRAFT_445039, partial [Lentinus tigrinus ALCF2SS1-7]
ISEDMKECAIQLWEAGWDEDDICTTLDVSRASLYRWRKLFSELGDVVHPPSPLRGRKRLVTRAAVKGMRTLLHTHPDTYLDELVWWLGRHCDIVISRSALHACLQEVGLTHKHLQKLAAERDEELQADKNDHTTCRRRGYAMAGERAEITDVFVRGDRYSLAAAITKDGYIATRALLGSYDSDQFYDFIVEEVLPQMGRWPLEPRSVLVVDNCRIHHNEALVDAVRNAG